VRKNRGRLSFVIAESRTFSEFKKGNGQDHSLACGPGANCGRAVAGLRPVPPMCDERTKRGPSRPKLGWHKRQLAKEQASGGVSCESVAVSRESYACSPLNHRASPKSGLEEWNHGKRSAEGGRGLPQSDQFR
jgi:hypothetical protein